MIDVLIDSFVVDRASRVIDPDPSGDLLRGPALFEAIPYVLPDEVALQALMFIGRNFSFTGPSMSPAGRIALTLRR